MSALSVKERALRLALQYALPVFPCNHNKTPATRNGFHDATTDPELIELRLWDNRLTAVRTGAISGLAVLDIDARHGGYDWLKMHARYLPFTRSHLTRSKGIHLLFATDGTVRCSAGVIAPGVDVRGEGGCFIWWPAHGYRVLDYLPLTQLPRWPEWLTPERQCPRFDGYSARGSVIADPFRVSRLTKFVRDSRPGQRNSRLYWAACRLAELRFERPPQVNNAAQRLVNAAIATGLDGDEASRTIASALTGMRNHA